MPELEEREAAIFSGYTWKQWLEFDLLDPEGRWNRAAGVAHYRVHQLIEAHKESAVSEDLERKYKSNG